MVSEIHKNLTSTHSKRTEYATRKSARKRNMDACKKYYKAEIKIANK